MIRAFGFLSLVFLFSAFAGQSDDFIERNELSSVSQLLVDAALDQDVDFDLDLDHHFAIVADHRLPELLNQAIRIANHVLAASLSPSFSLTYPRAPPQN